MASSIEWLQGGETWNPIRARMKYSKVPPNQKKAAVLEELKVIPAGKVGWACVHASPGCLHCYAEKQNVQCGTNKTRYGTGLKYDVPSLDQVEIFLDEETLYQPMHWRKGRLIFPCSMTDWMADFVPDEFRDKMLVVMARTPQHTYLTLTKRADRQRAFLARYRVGNVKLGWHTLDGKDPKAYGGEAEQLFGIWPLPNLWLGTSCENQEWADKRIPDLLATPAAIRWVSAEPLLGPLAIQSHLSINPALQPHTTQVLNIWQGLDWVVAGGESGGKARPMHPHWARSLRDQCQASGVPFFFKQWGEYRPTSLVGQAAGCFIGDRWQSEIPNNPGGPPYYAGDFPEKYPTLTPLCMMARVGKKAAGRTLWFKEWSEYPIQTAKGRP